MTVNTPKQGFVRPPTASLSGQRLYLREDELESGVLRFLSIATVMKEATHAVRKDYNLTWSAAHMLITLGRTPTGVAILATILGVTKQSAIKTAEDLEGRGLLMRETDLRDARRRPLRLTDEGYAQARAILVPLRTALASAYRQAGGEAVSGSDAVLSALIGGKPS
jgi:DNA-binding MarR family transcriptional regulator